MKRLKTFKLGQRVVLVEATTDDKSINGTSFILRVQGTVVRLRRQDEGAWLQLDERLTGDREALHPFPADDPTRSAHVLSYPEFCEGAIP